MENCFLESTYIPWLQVPHQLKNKKLAFSSLGQNNQHSQLKESEIQFGSWFGEFSQCSASYMAKISFLHGRNNAAEGCGGAKFSAQGSQEAERKEKPRGGAELFHITHTLPSSSDQISLPKAQSDMESPVNPLRTESKQHCCTPDLLSTGDCHEGRGGIPGVNCNTAFQFLLSTESAWVKG